MNDPTLLVVLSVMWPFGEGKKMLENHTHMQFNLFAVLVLLIPKALTMSHFLYVGIIAFLVQIKGQSCVLGHHDDVLFSSSL